jgi:hypothetical protein
MQINDIKQLWGRNSFIVKGGPSTLQQKLVLREDDTGKHSIPKERGAAHRS